jgi:hypothetical protein
LRAREKKNNPDLIYPEMISNLVLIDGTIAIGDPLQHCIMVSGIHS